MSEDPVKYEPALPKPDWRDAELPDHRMERIRIEALRTAATIMSAIISSGRKIEASDTEGIDTMTQAMAKQFAAYLEDG